MPLYFFRGNWTSGTQRQMMARVQWIPNFRLLKQSGHTFLGDIPLSTWNNLTPITTNCINSFIATIHLRPSRFALAFISPKDLTGNVNIAFIALDTENLQEDIQEYYDFGDNKFPYFKGNTNKRLEEFSEDKDSDDEDIEYVTNISVEKLYKYIPSNVLRFLSTPLNKL